MPKKFCLMTGGVRHNQWMQMSSPHQPQVPPWLWVPRTCGTNPQDLVCFPASPSHCSRLLPPSPLSVKLHQLFLFHEIFCYLCSHTVATHDLSSINLFTGSCSLPPISHPLIFPTFKIARAPLFFHFARHSLPPTFPPASSLIIFFLYPSLPVVPSIPAPLPLSCVLLLNLLLFFPHPLP